MKYLVTYSVTLSRIYVVEADSEQEACSKVYDAVENGNIKLTMEDFVPESEDATIYESYCDGDEDYFTEL